MTAKTAVADTLTTRQVVEALGTRPENAARVPARIRRLPGRRCRVALLVHAQGRGPDEDPLRQLDEGTRGRQGRSRRGSEGCGRGVMDLEGSMAANAASEEASRATLTPRQRASLERFDAESALDLANDYLARAQAVRDYASTWLGR